MAAQSDRVPEPADCATELVDRLAELLTGGGVVVLSGAGMSTDSGIPDYRGPNGALRSRLPMTIGQFTASTDARRRYWARSQVGWRRIASAEPNRGHGAVAALERSGHLRAVITQNVDGLHQRAGSRQVTELHGSLDRVACLDCGALSARARLDERLRAANGEPGIDGRLRAANREPGIDGDHPQVNPDGDAEVAEERVRDFVLVGCECCGSDMLKPDVVFFGENVPRPRVETCFDLVTHARALLVLGSSLTVMSGLRFVRHAHAEQIPVVIVNAGVTRGDPEASLKLDAHLGPVLAELTQRVGSAPERAAA